MMDIVIVSAVRTALGSFNGSLSTMPATSLGGLVIEDAVARAGLAKDQVSECIMGMVLPCGAGQNPAKQAAIKAGLPWEIEAFTVNKVCGSGLKAVMLAAQAIQCGDADIVVAGGMENMSQAPYFIRQARFGLRMGPGKIEDHMVVDGLWDMVNDFHMGMSNELCCEKWGVDRETQDRYAAESYRRSILAIESGKFQEEILTVDIPMKKGKTEPFNQDECPVETSYDQLAAMKPAFKKDGVGTAGNASVISDGASAVVLMSRKRANELGCEILATLGAQASYGIDMKYVLMAPIHSIPKCLKKEGVNIEDVDLFEINEAFSGSSAGINKVLGLDPNRVNVNGGSVALGHPIGASGCRVLVTLIHEMKRTSKKTGLASLCLGGGEAVSLIVKR
ncbi:MAG: acetyl-CoA C-acetyltransferase [Proteobacteria bacterium]|nr:acetyl-CoA C-acetyltransferase [Pseudomonadota bacterium]